MDLSVILLVIGGLFLLSAILGFALKSFEGRVKKEKTLTRISTEHLGEDVEFGKTATLLQFSSEMCTKCPGTRRFLTEEASQHPGVRHVDIDITHRPDLAQAYNIMQTPTTFILDEQGTVAARIGGTPRAEDLRNALTTALRRDHDNYVI